MLSLPLSTDTRAPTVGIRCVCRVDAEVVGIPLVVGDGVGGLAGKHAEEEKDLGMEDRSPHPPPRPQTLLVGTLLWLL